MIRQTSIALIFAIAGGVAGYLLVGESLTGKSQHGDRAPEQVANVSGPVASPRLSPEEVVSLQVDASRRARANPEHWKTSFAFASPANRKVTGPLERYAAMCQTQPYDLLIDGDEWLVGKATINNDMAYVLVSVSTQEGIFLYGFCLRKQVDVPYLNCWMTESVVPLPVSMYQASAKDAPRPVAKKAAHEEPLAGAGR